MYDCKKCGFHLVGTATKCPFCQGELTGESGEANVFPDIPFKEPQYDVLIRLLAFGTIVAVAVCIAVNYSVQETGWWSLFVAAGLLSVWIVVGIAVKKHSNPLKALLWQVCVGSLLALAWDYWIGFLGWSLDFVIPILYICSFLIMMLLVRFMHLKPQDYMLYLAWDLLLGVIPLSLLLCGMLRVTYPSLICVVVSIVGFTGLVLFKGPVLRAEFIRIFHL